MKIAFVGSREFSQKSLVQYITEKFLVPSSGQPIYNIFISGGAKGVDLWAEETAKNLGAERHIFLPDWDKHGKSAGFIRNKLIVNEADHIVAFWDGQSKGTKSTIDLAINVGKPVDIYIRRSSGT